MAQHDLARIAVFDPEGRFRRTVGRSGDGPGEYRFIGSIRVGSGDTIRVMDVRRGRVTVLSPELEFFRSINVEVPGMVVEYLSDDRFVMARDVATRQGTGLPLHVVGSDGRIARSFGAEAPAGDPGSGDLLRRVIALAPGGRVWSADLTRYRLELWDLGGRRLRALVRNVPWFEPNTDVGFRPDEPDREPNPGIMDLRLDDEGLLWVTLLVPDEDWPEGLGEVEGPHGRSVRGVVDRRRYGDSIVEVIDPRQGRLIASTRFDEPHGWAVGDGYAGYYQEDERGFPSVHIVRFRLTSTGRREP